MLELWITPQEVLGIGFGDIAIANGGGCFELMDNQNGRM
jgi:hypothetical protein